MNNQCKRTLLFLLAMVLLITTPAWAQLGEPLLRVGDWLNPEPWHNWIGGADGTSQVQLHVLDPEGEIQYVDFFYSIDEGRTWKLFGTDQDGSEPIYAVETAGNPEGDGWSAYFPHAIIPQEDMSVMFRATAHMMYEEFSVETDRTYDPTPPDDVAVEFEWHDDTLLVSVQDLYKEIATVIDYTDLKLAIFEKGIPEIDQRVHSDNHCAPTGAAACLKYFENQGDNQIGGGLSDHDLVDALAAEMGTSATSGTTGSGIVTGLVDWIAAHGNGYTVTNPGYDWDKMRNELERCQDVLCGVIWPGGGGHIMTLNSINNIPLPNDNFEVDFMDPWTGETETGELDPNTGLLTNLTGAGPTGTILVTFIVCPKESNSGGDGPGEPQGSSEGPNPPPIPLTFDEPGDYFVHVLLVDRTGNAHRFIKIVTYEPSAVEQDQGVIPQGIYLGQNTPNPFTSTTEIAFGIPTRNEVSLSVYNSAGQKVATLIRGMVEPGTHRVSWNGRDEQGRELTSGVYFCELMTADGFRQTRKMLLVE